VAGLSTVVTAGWELEEDMVFVVAVPDWKNPLPDPLNWRLAGDMEAFLDAVNETQAGFGTDRALFTPVVGERCNHAGDLAAIQKLFTECALLNNCMYDEHTSYAEHFGAQQPVLAFKHFCEEAGLEDETGWGFAYATGGATTGTRPSSPRTCTEGDLFALPQLMEDLLKAFEYIRTRNIMFHSPKNVADKELEPFDAKDSLLLWEWGDGMEYYGEGEADDDTESGWTLQEVFEYAKADHSSSEVGPSDDLPGVYLSTEATISLSGEADIQWTVELVGSAHTRDLEFTPGCFLASYDIWGRATKGSNDQFDNTSWDNVDASVSVMINGGAVDEGDTQSRTIGVHPGEVSEDWYPEPEDVEFKDFEIEVDPPDTVEDVEEMDATIIWSVSVSGRLNGQDIDIDHPFFTVEWQGGPGSGGLAGAKNSEASTEIGVGIYQDDCVAKFTYGETELQALGSASATVIYVPEDCEEPEEDGCANPEEDIPPCSAEEPDDPCGCEDESSDPCGCDDEASDPCGCEDESDDPCGGCQDQGDDCWLCEEPDLDM
jgi:hypothetical protein